MDQRHPRLALVVAAGEGEAQPTHSQTPVSPWNTTDAETLVAEGWQWCATTAQWFRIYGPHAWRGACDTCRRRIRVEWEEVAR